MMQLNNVLTVFGFVLSLDGKCSECTIMISINTLYVFVSGSIDKDMP